MKLPKSFEILKVHLLIDHLLEVFEIQNRIGSNLFQVSAYVGNDIFQGQVAKTQKNQSR